jgi:hypothetical protein
MKASNTPQTISTILAQLGRGLHGALVYVGAEGVVHRCHAREGECRSRFRSNVGAEGVVNFDVGIKFRVNGKPSERWSMVIAYEGNDTYTVYLWRCATAAEKAAGLEGAVIESSNDVYAQNLKGVVERMYDDGLKARNGGFMPLGDEDYDE